MRLESEQKPHLSRFLPIHVNMILLHSCGEQSEYFKQKGDIIRFAF